MRIIENGSKQFDILAGEQIVTVTLKPKVFKKLEQAQENYLMWVAAIAGQMGEKTESGFILKEPNVQTFEKKPKEPKEGAVPVASAAWRASSSGSRREIIFLKVTKEGYP